MQNTSNTTTVLGYVRTLDARAYSASIYASDSNAAARVIKCNRNTSKRIEPPHLPRYGTSSWSRKSRHTMLQLAKSGSLASWTPYGPSSYREFSMVNAEGYDAVEYTGRSLWDYPELRSVVQNKILTEIVSGKSQLPVDLVELGKTKAMVTEAASSLLHAYRDLRAGRPFATFVREMKRTGFRSKAGNAWLEYIYGWAPTMAGAMDTAEVISSHLQQGSIVTGRVNAKAKGVTGSHNWYSVTEALVRAKATGIYQYTIQDTKLLKLSQLGFTNPLAIAWELLPWSFVLDWFVDVGGYINRMDWALGIKDLWWQYCWFRRRVIKVTYTAHPGYAGVYFNKTDPGIIMIDCRDHQREEPRNTLINSFKGFKKFTNESVRLTSSLALVDQQRTRIIRVR